MGQKLTVLVSNKTPPATSKTIPSVPLITFVKKRIATTTANNTRMIRSTEPIFFFMIYLLECETMISEFTHVLLYLIFTLQI